MRGRSSIVVRIAVLFSALVTIALFCIALWISIIVRHDIESLIISESSQTAVARASQLGETIEKIQWQLNAMALQPALRNTDRRAVAKLIRNFDGKLSPEAAVFFFAWPDGYEVTSSGASASLADRLYFQTIMAGKADWVLGEPAVGKTITTPIIPIAMAVKDESGATVGIVGISLKLESLSRIVTSFKLGEGGYGWIVDNGGTMLANPRPEFVLKLNIGNADKDAGFRGLSALAPHIQGSPSGNGTYTNAQGEAMLTCFTTIPNTPDWKLAINIPLSKFQATATSIVSIFIIGIAAAIGLFVVFSVFIGKSIARPIVQMVTSFKDLAEGDADLTKTLAPGRKDELGELAFDFNRFIAKLREIVLTLKAAQDELEGAGAKLRTNVSDTTSASSQITASIRSIGEKTRLQSAQVAESSSAVEEIAKNIESLDGIISEQAASVTEASASIEEMVGNIGAVTESAAKMAEAFASLGMSAKEGLALQELTFQRINEISTRSESLLEANEAISKIASQTNLLAMNAAIEAAHAGEAGKGFSVVADEIRNLAETAAEQSHSIGDELKQIRAKIEEVVVASRETGESFSKVMERIDDTDTIVQEVKNAMVEQMEGSTQVLEALKTMNDITSSVRTGSKEMSVGNETILGSIVALRDTSVEIQKNMEEIELGAVAITESAHRVSDVAEGSMTIIGKMDEAIGRFVV